MNRSRPPVHGPDSFPAGPHQYGLGFHRGPAPPNPGIRGPPPGNTGPFRPGGHMGPLRPAGNMGPFVPGGNLGPFAPGGNMDPFAPGAMGPIRPQGQPLISPAMKDRPDLSPIWGLV